MKLRLCALAVLFLVSLISNALAQGDLTPPGAPAPTMKTLDQVEPRTPITNLPYAISSPGSYYLTASLTGFASADGITISADNVTLDLNGFALVGVPGSFNGVLVSGTRSGICVRNGSVREWGYAGVNLLTAIDSQVLDIRASTNGLVGIWAGKSCRVANCTAFGNPFGGIGVKDGSSVEGCVASGNSLGIGTENGCMIRGCAVSENSADGITVWGKSVISECQVFKNGTNGIVGGHGSIITKCAVSENGGDGIRVIRNCQVRDNDCLENGRADGDGAGIHAMESGNRIEGNHVAGADRGLDIDGIDNYVADNTVRGNTDNYDIAAKNQLNILLCEVPESIDWPASVKFAGTLTCQSTSTNGITVNADSVTIDLNGHALTGPGSGSLYGIRCSYPYSNLRVLNGTIVNWQGPYGWGLSTDYGCTLVEDVVVVSNFSGMAINGGVVSRCSARANSEVGISVSGGGIVTESTAIDNGTSGFSLTSAAASGCLASGNDWCGFYASYAKITDCKALANSNGIVVWTRSAIVGNHCNGNSAGAGMVLVGGGGLNRVDSNYVVDNGWGFDVQSAFNVVTRNVAHGNMRGDYSITSVDENDVGPIGLAGTSMSPWANIQDNRW